MRSAKKNDRRSRASSIDFPQGFDIRFIKTPGLRLVNFPAQYQMQADVAVTNENGAEFVFQFRDYLTLSP